MVASLSARSGREWTRRRLHRPCLVLLLLEEVSSKAQRPDAVGPIWIASRERLVVAAPIASDARRMVARSSTDRSNLRSFVLASLLERSDELGPVGSASARTHRPGGRLRAYAREGATGLPSSDGYAQPRERRVDGGRTAARSCCSGSGGVRFISMQAPAVDLRCVT